MTSLAGLKLLLTRPEGQAREWQDVLGRSSVQTEHVPALAIDMLTPDTRQRLLLEKADIGIFVSSNAVNAAHEAGIKSSASWLAVGDTTASFACSLGFNTSSGGAVNSETLLQHEALADVSGKKIVIVRGQGGREYLAEQLIARGAIVNYCELYARSCPMHNRQAMLQALQAWQPHIISVGSTQTLENVLLLGEEYFSVNAQAQPYFLVPGARIADFAQGIGVKHCIQSRSMRVSDVLFALNDWWNVKK